MVKYIPEVSSCCWCISLRSGTKIFGFISLVAYTIYMILTCVLLALMVDYRSRGYVADDFWKDVAVASAEILMQTVQITTSVLLLIGAYEEKYQLIPPWLVSCVVGVAFDFVVGPAIFNATMHASDTVIGWAALTILTSVDDVYGFFVVYSYYRSLLNRGGQHAITL